MNIEDEKNNHPIGKVMFCCETNLQFLSNLINIYVDGTS